MTQKRTKSKLLQVDFEHGGKLPPQAIELEEAVLGAMLLEREACEVVIPILTDESFYKEQHGRIFNAILAVYRLSQPVDILTVTQQLKATQELELIGGAYAISLLTNRVASSANIEFHARIVQQKYLARELIRINTNLIQRAYSDGEDIFELYAEAEFMMGNALSTAKNNDVPRIDKLQATFIEESLKSAESGIPSGVDTGFRGLNKVTHGWQKGNLIILAGRPSMGKSALMLHSAYIPALTQKIPIAIFSLEVPAQSVVARINSSISELDASMTSKKQHNADTVKKMSNDCYELFNTPLYIDDTAGLTLTDFKAKARRLVQKHGVQEIFIDYLQLMSLGIEGNINREQEISKISRGLKIIAKELGIPIIALSQLSREVEKRASKIPQLSDLRESGAIEQDADLIMFIYRPAYYEIEFHEYESKEYYAKNLMVGVIAKHRDGPLGQVFFGWIGESAKVTNWDAATNTPEHNPLYSLDSSKKGNTFVEDNNKGPVEPSKLPINTDFLTENKPKNENDDIPF